MATYRQELIARIVQGMMAYYGPIGFTHEEAEKAACTIADDVIAREQRTRQALTTAAKAVRDASSAETCFEVLLKRLDAFHSRLNRQDADLRQIQGYTESTNYRLDDVQDSLDYLKSQLEKNDP